MSNPAPSEPSISYKWREISDLPEDLEEYRDRELEALAHVWWRQKESLEYKDRLKAFEDALGREWAIETGIIEGVYTLDRGVTQTLIQRGIGAEYITRDSTNQDPEIVARIIRSHEEALEGLFAFVKSERRLSTSYIKELHAALLRYVDTVRVFDHSGNAFDTPLEKGAYKKLPNNPQRANGSLHEYCPPEHVASEMDRLIEMHHRHNKIGVSALVEAAWLHHAFTQIHPFQDGNGRVARALSSLVFIKANLFPLVVNRDHRAEYIDALEAADRGDLLVLIQWFAQSQKRRLTKAIGSAADVKPVHSVAEAVQVTRDLLVDIGQIAPPEYLKTKEIAKALALAAQGPISDLVTSLDAEVGKASKDFQFGIATLGGPPLDELKTLGNLLEYDPNTNDFHVAHLAQLTTRGMLSQIVISFHGVGSGFRGLLAVAAYFRSGQGPVVPLSKDIFRITSEEPEAEISKRFFAWLNECLIEGLAEWRRSLI
jgi:Fic family protein